VSFIFLIALVIVAWLLYHQYFRALLQQGNIGKVKIALVAVGLVFLFMALTGRAHAMFALIGAAMTQVMRFAPLLVRLFPAAKNLFAGSVNSASPSQSQVQTATLTMTLDHVSGIMDGQVLTGEFTGRQLQSLSLDELKVLYLHCQQHDEEAARLLMSFIARERADSWDDTHDQQSNHHSPSAASSGPMGRTEALQLLGLEENPERKDIVAAHRSLMGKFHPDKGGNTYLATKLNTARDVLLESLKQV